MGGGFARAFSGPDISAAAVSIVFEKTSPMIKTEGTEALTLKGTQAESSQRKIEVVVQTGLQLARETDLHSLVQTATDAGRSLGRSFIT